MTLLRAAREPPAVQLPFRPGGRAAAEVNSTQADAAGYVFRWHGNNASTVPRDPGWRVDDMPARPRGRLFHELLTGPSPASFLSLRPICQTHTERDELIGRTTLCHAWELWHHGGLPARPESGLAAVTQQSPVIAPSIYDDECLPSSSLDRYRCQFQGRPPILPLGVLASRSSPVCRFSLLLASCCLDRVRRDSVRAIPVVTSQSVASSLKTAHSFPPLYSLASECDRGVFNSKQAISIGIRAAALINLCTVNLLTL